MKFTVEPPATLSSSTADPVYIDERWLLMRWDGLHHCVYAEWKAFATSAEFRRALIKAAGVIREKPGASFVNDTRKLELISDEDQHWLLSTWSPLAVAAGVKRLAIVMARTGLSKMAIQGMFKERGPRVMEAQTFDSVADALAWVGKP